jgi:putative endonuclease
MTYVYILHLRNDQLYAGLTRRMKERYEEHQKGRSPFTKKFLPVRLVFYETFLSHKDAQRRERYFKTAKGKSILRLMLRQTLAQIRGRGVALHHVGCRAPNPSWFGVGRGI